MSQKVELSLIIDIDKKEDIRKLQDAVSNGSLADLVKVIVLGGFNLSGGGVACNSATPLNHLPRERQAEPVGELKAVETVVGKVDTSQVPDTPTEKPKRPRGLAGRKRMGRA